MSKRTIDDLNTPMSDSNNDLMIEDSSVMSADHLEDHSVGHSTDTSDSSFVSTSLRIDSVTHPIYAQRLELERLINSNESDIIVSSSIKSFLDLHIRSITEDWSSKIMFQVRYNNCETLLFRDVIKHIGSPKLHKHIAPSYFCNKKYSTCDGFKGVGFKHLTDDLFRSAIKSSGFSLIKNGKTPYKNNGCFRFCCSCSQVYRGNVNKRSTLPYRDVSFSNNRKNNRSKITHNYLPARTKTKLPMLSKQRCPFFFCICFDIKGFFVVNGKGNSLHRFHSKNNGKLTMIPPRLLEVTSQQLITDLSHADASLGTMRNILHHKTGRIYQRSNLHHIRGLCGIIKNLEDDLHKCSTTDIMIKFLTEHKYDYVMLLHCNNVNTIFQQTKEFNDSQAVTNDSIEFPPVENVDINEFVNNRRVTLNVHHEQKFMMAFAWTTTPEKRMFKLFPSVIFCDCTEDTNNEGRPLLSMTGKDTNSRTFTIIRAFLPNQKMWVFRWVFSVLLPKVYGNELLKQVQVFITDGDPQETQQLDNGLDLFFPKAKRIRCGWHLIDRGWNARCPTVKAFPSISEFFDRMKVTIQSWCYSWMKPSYCETKAEYLISKFLFKKFMSNPSFVTKEPHKYLIATIMIWFKNNFEPHESNFCFYKRAKLLSFGDYSNSVTEGTHNGMKFNAASVGPSTSIHRSLAILTKNAIRKEEDRTNKSSREFLTTRTNDPDGHFNHMIEYAFISSLKCIAISQKYLNLKINDNEWLVVRDMINHPFINLRHFPRFIRVRKVTYRDGILTCNCPTKDVFKLLCPHVINVAKSCDKNFQVSHTNISCIWWKSYYESSLQPGSIINSKGNLTNLFQYLKNKEKIGIPIDFDKVDNIPIHLGEIPDVFVYDSNFPSCANYAKEDYTNFITANIPGNMSQIEQIDNEDTASLPIASIANTNGIINETHLEESSSVTEEVTTSMANIDDSPTDADSNSVTLFEYPSTVTENLTSSTLESQFNEIIHNSDLKTLTEKRKIINNPYQHLKKSFTELSNTMAKNSSYEEIEEVRKYLDNATNQVLKKIFDRRNVKSQEGEYISSNLPHKRSFTSHGTKYI